MKQIKTSKLERTLVGVYRRWLAACDNETPTRSDIHRLRTELDAFFATDGAYLANLNAQLQFPQTINRSLVQQTDRILTSFEEKAIQGGILAGLHPTVTAQAMSHYTNEALYSLRRLVRTETVKAMWQDQRQAVADMPGMALMWVCEPRRACPTCKARDGLIVENPNIYDHPNGRCTLAPVSLEDLPIRPLPPVPEYDRATSPVPACDPSFSELGQPDGHSQLASSPLLPALQWMLGQGFTPKQALRASGIDTTPYPAALLRWLGRKADRLHNSFRPAKTPAAVELLTSDRHGLPLCRKTGTGGTLLRKGTQIITIGALILALGSQHDGTLSYTTLVEPDTTY